MSSGRTRLRFPNASCMWEMALASAMGSLLQTNVGVLMWESRGLVTYVKANTNTFIINIFILLVLGWKAFKARFWWSLLQRKKKLSKQASRTFHWMDLGGPEEKLVTCLPNPSIGSSTKNRFERGDLVKQPGCVSVLNKLWVGSRSRYQVPNNDPWIPHDLHTGNRDSKIEIPSSTKDSFFKLFIPHCHVDVSGKFKKYLQFICISLFAVDMFNRSICFEPWFYKAKASIRSMVTMSCVAPIETWPRIVLRTMSQVAMKHTRMASKKSTCGSVWVVNGSNTPPPTIVWNLKQLGKQKIICHCYQTFEFCKAIGSQFQCNLFRLKLCFFGTTVCNPLWFLGGFVLGKTWQFIHLGVTKHRGSTWDNHHQIIKLQALLPPPLKPWKKTSQEITGRNHDKVILKKTEGGEVQEPLATFLV